MKYKTTSKAIKEGYYHIIPVGYCELQSLLKYKRPNAYTCGVYGWNYDVYDIGGRAICTGYRGMPSANVKKDSYAIAKKYEDLSHDANAETCDKLIADFINEVITV